jgi:hypothetical protein
MSRIGAMDILIFAGMIFVGYGLYLIGDPIPILAFGAGLMAIGLVGAYKKGQSK